MSRRTRTLRRAAASPFPWLLPCLLLAACGGDPAAQGRDVAAAIPVTTAVVREQAWNDVIRALGTAKAHESVTVTAKVSETVQQVHFESGDEVRAGAPLVTLSGQQQRASLAAAEATAAEAERLYRRQQELAGQQLIARSALDAQLATRDAARAQVAQIRANLADRVIRAPFAGVLGIRLVSPGALITPGTAVATLDDISHVYVDFPVPEARLASLATGQRVAATSAAYPGRAFEGTVSTIEARVDPATRALTVRGDFANPDRSLRPGMLLQVQLQMPERKALVLPEIAVVQVGNDSYVWRVKPDDTVERADVELGSRSSGRVVVDKGLAAGDRIVVDGTGKLRAGAKIADGVARAGAPAPAGRG
ncbi:MAG TPA: efflux RND transporter periplasmic adaptor subunit [Luteimonas sp.]|nr:efflux RND transporter periplasmic adaptor subunit [Luteimonas sp.]